MATSAEGIVEKAELFFGVARRCDSIEIILMADAYGPIPNAKCRVTFKDGQITEVKSDSGGTLMFQRKAQGDFIITVMEAKKVP